MALALNNAQRISYANSAYAGTGQAGQRRLLMDIDGRPTVELMVSPDEIDHEIEVMAKDIAYLLNGKLGKRNSRSKQMALLKALENLNNEESV